MYLITPMIIEHPSDAFLFKDDPKTKISAPEVEIGDVWQMLALAFICLAILCGVIVFRWWVSTNCPAGGPLHYCCCLKPGPVDVPFRIKDIPDDTLLNIPLPPDVFEPLEPEEEYTNAMPSAESIAAYLNCTERRERFKQRVLLQDKLQPPPYENDQNDLNDLLLINNRKNRRDFKMLEPIEECDSESESNDSNLPKDSNFSNNSTLSAININTSNRPLMYQAVPNNEQHLSLSTININTPNGPLMYRAVPNNEQHLSGNAIVVCTPRGPVIYKSASTPKPIVPEFKRNNLDFQREL